MKLTLYYDFDNEELWKAGDRFVINVKDSPYTIDLNEDDSELVRLLSKLKEECKEDALNIELDNQFSVYGEFIAKGNF